jgi:hypothetical protein
LGHNTAIADDLRLPQTRISLSLNPGYSHQKSGNRAMNGNPSDAQTKALEFVNSASTYVLLATMALLAWVASGVEFSNDVLRLPSVACLTLSVVFGVATLALVPLVQEARRPGQSNFDVEARFSLAGTRSMRLKAMLVPQYLFLLAGLVLYVIGA